MEQLAMVSDALHDPKGLFGLFAIIALILYGLSVGRTKALISLLSIYVAYALTTLFPYMQWLSDKTPVPYQPLAAIAVFVVFYIVTFFVLSNSLTRTRLTLGELSVWKVVVISIAQVGLLASMCASLVPSDVAARFSGPFRPFIGTSIALWIWAALALGIMPFIRGGRRAH